MFRLRRLEHAYLHELFKAVLLYDAPKVKKALARKIGGKLMNEWILVKPYQEITPTPERERYRKAADIIWTLKHPAREELGRRRVIHEVKTGNCYVSDIVHSYKNLHFCTSKEGKTEERKHYFGKMIAEEEKNPTLYKREQSKTNERDAWQDECSHDYAGTTNTPIYIWSWKKNRVLPEDYETKKLIKRGAVRLLPLDWLLPILEEGMSVIFEWTEKQ